MQVEEVVDGKVAVDWEGEVARLQVEPDGIYEPSEECPGGKMVVLEGPLVTGNVYDRRSLSVHLKLFAFFPLMCSSFILLFSHGLSQHAAHFCTHFRRCKKVTSHVPHGLIGLIAINTNIHNVF